MSNSALPQRVVAKSPLKSSLIELVVVVILGACAGAAFEALRPGRQDRTRPRNRRRPRRRRNLPPSSTCRRS